MASSNVGDLSLPVLEGNVIQQHPQSDYIRDKVDWWFSDENLKKDAKFRSHLISKGDENSIINAHHLVTRDLLRLKPKPKPRQIVNALRNSSVVDVIDKEHIRRKVVFKFDDNHEDDIWSYNGRPNKYVTIPPHPGIKAGTYMKGVGTGFETGFIDAPITPKQYEEERKLYNPEENDVASRIGFAIESFVRRRKFTQRYQAAFGSFLAYGGIYPASRIGQGDNDFGWEDEDLTKEQKYDIFAKYDMEWEDKNDLTKWEVDFEGVAKGYLSSQFATYSEAYTDESMDNQCTVMSSFYNYLLIHDACPEHTESIKAALSVTVRGAIQLKRINRLSAQLPSPFHKACLVLLDEGWKGIYGQEGEWLDPETKVLRQGAARLITGVALMAKASASVYDAVYPSESTTARMESLALTDKIPMTLEVVAIKHATEETKQLYKRSGLTEKEIDAEPLGELACKSWLMDDFSEYDLPTHLMPGVSHCEEKTYNFWLEDSVLNECFVGIKIKADIRQLVLAPDIPYMTERTGEEEPIWIIDTISAICCSFYTDLINSVSTIRSAQPKFFDETACFSCDHPLAKEIKEHVKLERKNETEKREREEKERREVLEGVGVRKLEEKRGVPPEERAEKETSTATKITIADSGEGGDRHPHVPEDPIANVC